MIIKNQINHWNKQYKLNKNMWARETESLPKIMVGKNVLELGCGNGKTLKSILKQSPKNITAIDFSKEAVIISRKIFHQNNVNILLADCKNLPFNNDEFDIVICHYLLNNSINKDRIKIVDEIFRVLKKNGKVIFEDFSIGDFRDEKERKILEKGTKVKDNGIICHFFTLSELYNLFKNFGNIDLKIIKINPIKNKPKLKRKLIRGLVSK